jgi:homoserine acetyltransferase
MNRKIDKSLFLIKIIPFGIVKKNIKKAVMKKVSNQLTEREIMLMSEICDEMARTLTKDYEIHMTLLLKDLQNYWNMKKSDFDRFKGKILLILSDDDFTFNDNVKQALIEIMPNPKIITDIRGGHLALLLKLDKYVQVIKDFIDNGN